MSLSTHRLYRMAWAMTRCEDEVQELVVAGWLASQRVSKVGYIWTAMKRRLAEIRRSCSSVQFVPIEEVFGLSVNGVERRVMVRELMDVAKRLGSRHFQTLLAVYECGGSMAEAGRMLGVSRQRVQAMISDIRRCL